MLVVKTATKKKEKKNTTSSDTERELKMTIGKINVLLSFFICIVNEKYYENFWQHVGILCAEMQAFSVDLRQLNGRVPSAFNANAGGEV